MIDKSSDFYKSPCLVPLASAPPPVVDKDDDMTGWGNIRTCNTYDLIKSKRKIYPKDSNKK